MNFINGNGFNTCDGTKDVGGAMIVNPLSDNEVEFSVCHYTRNTLQSETSSTHTISRDDAVALHAFLAGFLARKHE